MGAGVVEVAGSARERHLSEYVTVSCPHTAYTVEKDLRVYPPQFLTPVRPFLCI